MLSRFSHASIALPSHVATTYNNKQIWRKIYREMHNFSSQFILIYQFNVLMQFSSPHGINSQPSTHQQCNSPIHQFSHINQHKSSGNMLAATAAVSSFSSFPHLHQWLTHDTPTYQHDTSCQHEILESQGRQMRMFCYVLVQDSDWQRTSSLHGLHTIKGFNEFNVFNFNNLCIYNI